MAKKRDLEITIKPNGEVEVHVSGMPGKECLKIKEILEKELGPVESERYTSEYYQAEEAVRISVEQRGK